MRWSLGRVLPYMHNMDYNGLFNRRFQIISELLSTPVLNTASPNIKMYILLTVIHTFLLILAGRIYLNIKDLLPFDDHLLYSHGLYIEQVVIL